jgi:hypothetical protein
MEISPETASGLVDYMEGTQQLLQKVAAERDAARQSAPEVVDALIKAGMLEESARGTAIELLGNDHLKALESLKTAAAIQPPEAPPSMGAGSPEGLGKSASDQGSSDPYRRFNSEADRQFEDAILDRF